MNTNHLSELWKTSLVFGPIFAFLFGLSVNSLFLGFTKYDECPFEPFLPRGFIGFGILGSIFSITALFLTIFSFFQVDDSGTHLFYLLYAFIALVGYGLSATILAIATASMLYMKHSSHQSENFHDTQSFCYASIYNFCTDFTGILIKICVLIFFIWFIRFFCNKLYKLFRRKLSKE